MLLFKQQLLIICQLFTIPPRTITDLFHRAFYPVINFFIDDIGTFSSGLNRRTNDDTDVTWPFDKAVPGPEFPSVMRNWYYRISAFLRQQGTTDFILVCCSRCGTRSFRKQNYPFALII